MFPCFFNRMFWPLSIVDPRSIIKYFYILYFSIRVVYIYVYTMCWSSLNMLFATSLAMRSSECGRWLLTKRWACPDRRRDLAVKIGAAFTHGQQKVQDRIMWDMHQQLHKIERESIYLSTENRWGERNINMEELPEVHRHVMIILLYRMIIPMCIERQDRQANR
jgi:hypothetical protein